MSENKHTPDISLKQRAEAIGLYESRLIDWVIHVENLTARRDELTLIVQNQRQQIAHLNDDMAGQKSNLEFVNRQRDEAQARAVEMEQRSDRLTLDFSKMVGQRDELLAALAAISKITGDAGFNIGGPLEHCPGELEHDEAKRLLSLACEYLKDTSKEAIRAIASVKGSKS